MKQPEVFTPDSVIITKQTIYECIPIHCRSCNWKGTFSGTHAEYLRIYNECPTCHKDRCYADTYLIVELAKKQHNIDITTLTPHRSQRTAICRHYWIWQQTHRPINSLFIMSVE